MAGLVIQGFFVGGGMRRPGAGRERFDAHSAPGLQAAGTSGRPGAPPLAGGRGPVPRPTGAGATHRAASPSRPTPVVQAFRSQGSFTIDPAEVGLESGGGKPLPAVLLAKMEAAFGTDFSSVRVHVGAQAARIGAIAFTTGNDIYFANGQFQPETARGRQLIGHELAHVVQQRQGRVSGAAHGVTVVQDPMLEAEAERMGWRAAGHHARAVPNGHAPAGAATAHRYVQRAQAPVTNKKRKLDVALPNRAAALAPVPLVRAKRMLGPTLSTGGYSTRTTGPCGGMNYIATFQLTIPRGTERDGFILQKITRKFAVKRMNALADMTWGAIDAYVALNPGSAANATEIEYWEVWTVDDGTISDNAQDEFAMCSFVDNTPWPHLDTTAGKFRIRGSATYYACGANARNRFVRNLANPAASAGVLPSTLTDPTHALPVCATSNTLVRTVKSSWDSTSLNGAVTQDTVVVHS